MKYVSLSFFRVPRHQEGENHCPNSDFQATYSRFMSMSYSHYFKPDSHERVYDTESTSLQRNYGYSTSSFGPMSPHSVSIKQEPREFNFENSKF